MAYLAVRIKGTVNRTKPIERTLNQLRLTRSNHAVVLPANATSLGMLKKVKDVITWGEADEGMVEQLLRHRGRMTGDVPLTDAAIKSATPYPTFGQLAKALASDKVAYHAIEGVKPIFRLHPPVGGHGLTKRTFVQGGALGYRGAAINDLVGRMLAVDTGITAPATATATAPTRHAAPASAPQTAPVPKDGTAAPAAKKVARKAKAPKE